MVMILKSSNRMGLVEPIRYLLAYGNIQHENMLISDAEWLKLQKVVPFGMLPVLEVDGKSLVSSVAISRFIARKISGLVPVSELELAELNSIVEVSHEIGLRVILMQEQSNQELKNIILRELVDILIPRWLAELEVILKNSGGRLGGMKLSWADIYVVGLLDWIERALNQSLVAKLPLLQAMIVEVQNVPAIQAYISRRQI